MRTLRGPSLDHHFAGRFKRRLYLSAMTGCAARARVATDRSAKYDSLIHHPSLAYASFLRLRLFPRAHARGFMPSPATRVLQKLAKPAKETVFLTQSSRSPQRKPFSSRKACEARKGNRFPHAKL